MPSASAIHRKLPCVAAIAFLPLLQTSSAQDAATSPATPVYRVGTQSIVLPAPTGDLQETGSDYRVLLEFLAPSSNRLVAAFLMPDELKVIRTGSVPKLSTYALVEVPRRAEFADVSSEDFKQVADGLSTQFGAVVDSSLKDQQNALNERLKALNSSAATVTLDKPIQLGAFFSRPNEAGFGMIVSVAANGSATNMVMGMAVVRVRHRILMGYLFTEYKDAATVQWIRTTTEHWADGMLAANK